MTLKIRPARADELRALSDLCLRSKAVWGYDDAFMAACRPELTLAPQDLDAHLVAASRRGEVVGVLQLDVQPPHAEIVKLFVEPTALGEGVGRTLAHWAIERARSMGAAELTVEADPGAEGFYLALGMACCGQAPSGSIPGRTLPVLRLDLSTTVKRA